MRDHQLDMNADFVAVSDGDAADDDDDRHVLEWEDGLPSAGDLTPLSQQLIPPELASAFRINPELPRTILDVHRASQTTFSSLLSATSPVAAPAPTLAAADATVDESSPKSSKKPRLVWTPQLHKRFVEVVAHLGLKNAVPKTIMQLMNVEGLTRENVASHLQKYRLYVKRMHGISDDAPLSPTTSAAASRDANAPSRSFPPPPPPHSSSHHHHHHGS